MKSKFLLSLCVVASAQNLVIAKDAQAPQQKATIAKKSISEIITNDITTATALAAALRRHAATLSEEHKTYAEQLKADANQLDVLKTMATPNLINAIRSEKHGLSAELAKIIKDRNVGKPVTELFKALTAFKK